PRRGPAARATRAAGAAGTRGGQTGRTGLGDGVAVAVAAPVRAHDGAVIAAISVSGPVFRMTPDQVPVLGARTAAAADELSRRMGYGS
ncbi:IclR family transcriptional regulator C-terminal domain-containing protein, partial [Streptomyces griseoincarnatus]